jgi:hypothetical protein
MSSLLAVFLAVALASNGPATIELGGLRKAQAVVNLDGDQYEIKVRFLSVTCFDQSTNQEMNLSVGRSLALQALARHLTARPNVELIVSGARTTETALAGRNYSLTLKAPRDGVKIVEGPGTSDKGSAAAPAVAGTELASGRGLTRRAQYEQTIAQLNTILRNEFNRLNAEAAPDRPSSAQLESFEKKVTTTFEQLAQEIKDDIELTNLGSDLDTDAKAKGEKDQLLESLAAARQRLLAELKGQNSR